MIVLDNEEIKKGKEEGLDPGESQKSNRKVKSRVGSRSRRSPKASEKAKRKMEEKINDSTSEDHEVVFLDEDDEFEKAEEDESEYEEMTTRRGRKSGQEATSTKSNAKSRPTIDIDLRQEDDEERRTRKPNSCSLR